MLLLINICELNWVPVFLSWLLPFLLGLLLGRMIWGPFKIRFLDQEKELAKYKERVNELDADLQASQKSRTQLEAESAVLRGRVRELESMTQAGAQLSKANVAIPPSKPKVESQPTKPQPTKPDTVKPITEPEPGSDLSRGHFGALTEDHLQIIEGIGPRMESMLKENGIISWAQLAEQDESALRDMLEKEDPKLRIIDPVTWPRQAELANSRSWEELVQFQRNMAGQGDDAARGNTKVEKWMIQAGILRKFKQDDLKAIEGIGPKIANLLRSAGIDSWEKLAQCSVESLQSILDSAGDRFRLADPMTWPTQAALAARGEWSELEKLQDHLTGGRPADKD